MIYVAAHELTDAVKIGYSRDVPRRARELTKIGRLATGLQFTVQVLIAVEGNTSDERCVHKLLAAETVGPEWFSGAKTKTFLALLRDGMPARRAVILMDPFADHRHQRQLEQQRARRVATSGRSAIGLPKVCSGCGLTVPRFPCSGCGYPALLRRTNGLP